MGSIMRAPLPARDHAPCQGAGRFREVCPGPALAPAYHCFFLEAGLRVSPGGSSTYFAANDTHQPSALTSLPTKIWQGPYFWPALPLKKRHLSHICPAL